MKKKKTNKSMPQSVARRIMRRAASGEKTVVVTIRNGKPSQVFGFEEYLTIREVPKKVKPWEHRSAKKSPDPLGAIAGKVLGPLTREDFYQESE
jgi:hypothetical protein